MFYWSCGDVYVVLSDEEEMALVREVSKGPVESVEYNYSRVARRDIERRIFSYLGENLRTDPEAFHRKYVFRSCYGEDAQKMFPVLLDAYGRITRRAVAGFHGERPLLEGVVEGIYHALTESAFEITLLERGRWPWTQPVASGYILLPVASIEKLAGTADNFFVASASAVVKFHRDFVRVSVLSKHNAPESLTDSCGE